MKKEIAYDLPIFEDLFDLLVYRISPDSFGNGVGTRFQPCSGG
jgi:hypothetical protein